MTLRRHHPHRTRALHRLRLAFERWARDRKRPKQHVAEERAVLHLLKRMPKRGKGRLAISASGIARTTGLPPASVNRALDVLITRKKADWYAYEGRRVFVLARVVPTGMYRVPSRR